MFLCGKIFFNPYNGALISGGAQGKGNNKSRCSASIARFISKDFMHAAALQAITEDVVNGIVSEIKGGAMRR